MEEMRKGKKAPAQPLTPVVPGTHPHVAMCGHDGHCDCEGVTGLLLAKSPFMSLWLPQLCGYFNVLK